VCLNKIANVFQQKKGYLFDIITATFAVCSSTFGIISASAACLATSGDFICRHGEGLLGVSAREACCISGSTFGLSAAVQEVSLSAILSNVSVQGCRMEDGQSQLVIKFHMNCFEILENFFCMIL